MINGMSQSENLKFKITLYFVTIAHILIFNIASTKPQHKYIKKHKDRDALDLQNI